MLRRRGKALAAVAIVAAVVLVSLAFARMEMATPRFSLIPVDFASARYHTDAPLVEEPEANTRAEESSGPEPPIESGPWDVVGAEGIASVVWSPNGDQIAFVPADLKYDTDLGLSQADIWVMSIPKHGETIELTRLITLSDDQGIPAAMFWLDNDRLGWAAAGGTDYKLMQMSLRDCKPRRLVDQRFTGNCGDVGPGSAPQDLYYDAASNTLIFSGELAPIGTYLRVLSLSTGKVRDKPIPHPEGLEYPDGYLSYVSCCGSVADSDKPVIYVAAVISPASAGGWCLWRSDSYALRQDSIIATSQSECITHPRVSPDGRFLAYLRNGQIELRDLRSGKVTQLAKRSEGYLDFPVIGCPYSWSPDGKQIAYSDGSRIRIVQVDAGQSDQTED